MRIALVMMFVLMGLLAGRATSAAETPLVVLILGDSLSAGYGLRAGEAWPDLLQARVQTLGDPVRIVNASVSGETTAGGLSRLPALLQAHQPRVVVVELGANDGLRGLPLKQMQANLRAIVSAIRRTDAEVLLIPMRMPPNYGPAYATGFAQVFEALPEEFGRVSLTPFFLKDIALNPALLQADGLHPKAEAQALMLDAVWSTLVPVLAQTSQGTP
jgi:acyl-CoA thioesterase-1